MDEPVTTSAGRPISPRIEALSHDVAGGHAEAVTAFWRDVEAEGTPMVEPSDDPDHVLVTFVWRDLYGDTRTVAAVGGPATWIDINRDAMSRVGGTDVWSVTYRVRSDLRGRYYLAPNDPLTSSEDETDWETREARFRPDPWNPRRLAWPANPMDPTSRAHEMSVLELPDAPPQPWRDLREGVVAGSVETTMFRSRILGNERRVWVHTPAGPLRRGLGLVVVFDGWVWGEALPLAPTIDNLIAFGQIPPVITVMVDAMDDDTRIRELECDPAFLRAICDELVPWIRDRRRVSRDPARTVVAGQSLGGLTAAFAALERPDVFGNAIVQSGSFWWPRGSEFDIDAHRLTRWYVERPPSPTRVFMEVGLLEGPDMVPTSRHLRDVMQAKGYDLTYREYHGGHDWFCWRGGMADGLVALLGSSSPVVDVMRGSER